MEVEKNNWCKPRYLLCVGMLLYVLVVETMFLLVGYMTLMGDN
jgi:hypothetical protein